jgi:methylamine dehydrogenase accessory protein MauD
MEGAKKRALHLAPGPACRIEYASIAISERGWRRMNGVWVASYVALWVIVGAMAFIIMGLLRQFGLIQMRLDVEPGALITGEGLERGAVAPEFAGKDVMTDRDIRLRDMRDRRVALTFITPTCDSCRSVVSFLNGIASQWSDVQMVTICHGAPQACRELGDQTGLRVPLLADPVGAIAANYKVSSTPHAVLIDEQGTVLIRGLVNTWPQFEALLEERGMLRSGVKLQDIMVGEAQRGVRGNDMSASNGLGARTHFVEMVERPTSHGGGADGEQR